MSVKAKGLIVFLWICLPGFSSAQNPLNVPNNTKNHRFYNDVFNIQRPALSISGFNNAGDHSNGYGLKQILEKLYSGNSTQFMLNSYNEIVKLSTQQLKDPFNAPDRSPLNVVNGNSNILQSRAFVALARYVLDKNGITEQIPNSTVTAPPSDVAIADLKRAFKKPTDWLLANSNHKDR